MKSVDMKYRSLPFWSWNGDLKKEKLVKQIDRMYEWGIGGFFMHARGGLQTEYLGKEWFECIDACCKRAEELGMYAYAYDENGWPSGFVGGKLLEDLENRDRHLTYTVGEFDPKAFVSYEISEDTLTRVAKSDKECLNVYHNYSASTADILSSDTMDKFIAMTHEEYKARDKHGMKGFFTDEPQYYRWGMPYTKALPEYFKREYGEDILDGLGLMFVKKNGYRAFRYKYWSAMQALMLENFSRKIYGYCEDNGYIFTGHYISEDSLAGQMLCCAGIMPFYEYEHIPGIDKLCRALPAPLASRQVSSAAAQLNKKQVMTETFAMCGWDATPDELRLIGEAQYVRGVNLTCQHLVPYSEHGQRKRDYPPHFSDVNPWVRKAFGEFNGYFSVLGMMIAESREQVRIGVMHPIRSAYFEYSRIDGDSARNVGELDSSLASLLRELEMKHLPHHLVDETILFRHGKVEGKTLKVGECSYDRIILPKMYTMDRSTEKLLREYVKAGGRVLIYDGAPTYLEGEEYCYDYLESNITFEQMLSERTLACDGGDDIVTSIRYDGDGRCFVYAVNLGSTDSALSIIGKHSALQRYDIMSDSYTTVPCTVEMKAGESGIFYPCDEKIDAVKEYKELHLGPDFTVIGATNNFLTLDFAGFSTDGVNYSEPLHHMGIFNELLKMRYAGELYLRYEFDAEQLPDGCKLLVEDTRVLSVSVNGAEVKRLGCCDNEDDVGKYEIGDKLLCGHNLVTVKLDYFQSEAVYYALFGEGVTESMKNCLAYDSNIEPVYLMGDFGVYGDIKQTEENRYIGRDFRIGARRDKVRELVTEGYPFFAGDITLEQTVYHEGGNCLLVLDGRFHIADIRINGEECGRLMFTNKLDLSKHIKAGENTLQITLTVGNRNMLGPFHTEQEITAVSPSTFERIGSWKDGKSPLLCPDYAFVKSLL